MQRTSFEDMACPIARSLERVGEWWSMLILRDAFAGMTQFDEFQKSLGIAPNMLTRRLAALVEAGMLERRRYSERPPRDEYLLTERGRDFRPVLVALLAFGNRHFAPEGESVLASSTPRPARRPSLLVDRATGRPLVDSGFRARRRPGRERGDAAEGASGRAGTRARRAQAPTKARAHERRRPSAARLGAAPRRAGATRDEPAHAALLHGPIMPTLLRLAWPNVLVMLAQASTGLIETWWVSRLGTDALAGMALVFPGFMMMQMLSAGAIGGGISSAVARALGAGRRADADALVLHALLINLALGLASRRCSCCFGRQLYRGAWAAKAARSRRRCSYSNVVFAGIVLVWLMNALASVIRGTGNMLLPSLAICVGVVAAGAALAAA